MQRPDSLPPIGSLVHVQARGMITPYVALVVGHPQTKYHIHPTVEVVSSAVEGGPYELFAEFVREVG
jgi:hypothetical protein